MHLKKPNVHLHEKVDASVTNQKQFVWNPHVSFMQEQQQANVHLQDAVARVEALSQKLLKTVQQQKHVQRFRHDEMEERMGSIYKTLLEATTQQDAIHHEISKQAETVFRLRRSLQNHRLSMNDFAVHQYDDLDAILDMLDKINAHNKKMGDLQHEVLEKLTLQDVQNVSDKLDT